MLPPLSLHDLEAVPLGSARRKFNPSGLRRHRETCGTVAPEPWVHNNAPQRQPILPVVAGIAPSVGVISIERYKEDGRDWRKLSPADIARQYVDCHRSRFPPRGQKGKIVSGSAAAAELAPCAKRREGLMAAVAAGNLQAADEGFYWAPGFSERHGEEVHGVLEPKSRLIAPPTNLTLRQVHEEPPALQACSDPRALPLDVCLQLAAEEAPSRIAMVQFVTAGTPPSSQRDLGHAEVREVQMLLRTTYLQALNEMERHLHTDAVSEMQAGSVVYTSDVSIIRGPIEDGAVWLHRLARIDVICVALQRNPLIAEDGRCYGSQDDLAAAASAMQTVMAVASQKGVRFLVMPPPGAGGASGCRHPTELADLLLKAATSHGVGLKQVIICRDHESQLLGRWDDFAASLQKGIDWRPPPPVPEPTGLLAKKNYKAAAAPFNVGWMRRLKQFPPRNSEAASKSASE